MTCPWNMKIFWNLDNGSYLLDNDGHIQTGGSFMGRGRCCCFLEVLNKTNPYCQENEPVWISILIHLHFLLHFSLLWKSKMDNCFLVFSFKWWQLQRQICWRRQYFYQELIMHFGRRAFDHSEASLWCTKATSTVFLQIPRSFKADLYLLGPNLARPLYIHFTYRQGGSIQLIQQGPFPNILSF